MELFEVIFSISVAVLLAVLTWIGREIQKTRQAIYSGRDRMEQAIRDLAKENTEQHQGFLRALDRLDTKMEAWHKPKE